MNIIYWFISLIVPFTMIFMGKVLERNPPKEINDFYGYRRKRSKKSQKAWDYAQVKCGNTWFKLGVGLGIISIVLNLFIPTKIEILSVINMIIGVCALILTIPYVENKLKKNFE
ncbi:hypothetical protein BH721_02265 [Clostridium baratii]|uniref:SdpI family protein n=1 Tax=Clostridium baratii TaxID=1561 RepID=UPI0009A2E16F|nr:SdpI family protein [Clostridium baratii]OPF51373.1 hypothetical protein A1M12_02210 [Clostridium baratii]OPF55553.1 hypothetical protein BH721_02265 [Clostridium baratii]OPF57068.1 hypothetical protein BH724_11165 [Clostridium baratii]OPF60066.1 hypothetical protein BH725_05660 [Clostridium baratii]